MKIDKIKTEVVGRWIGIFDHFGINVGNGQKGPCPICGGKDRYHCDDKDGSGSYYCQQCGAGDGWSMLMKVLNINFIDACKEVEKIIGTVEQKTYQKEKTVSPELLRKMFKESSPVMKNDHVHAYLKRRGLRSIPNSLRCSTKCYEPETKKEQIAMLAVFSDKDAQAITIHRTYLNNFGFKLDIKNPKKIMPALKKMSGGAVRLYKHESGPLGICEGIETAIACHELAKIPVWAALSTSLLEGFEPPKNIKEIHIFADNDKNFAGQKSAYILANKLALKDIIVEVKVPSIQGNDWLDEITMDEINKKPNPPS